MTTISTSRLFSPETRGLLLGLVGVLLFSLNLPMTRLAAQELDPLLIGLARCLLASVLASWAMAIDNGPRPDFGNRQECLRFGLTSFGLVVGCLFFPFAMRYVSAGHGAVLVGIQPLLTAIVAFWRNGERPSAGFWLFAALGSLTVIAFSLTRHGPAEFAIADLAMLGAVIFCAIGYAEGGRLATRFGGWRTICWAMAISGPFLLLPTVWVAWHSGVTASAQAWFSLAYISVFGLLLGSYPWYAGLALGGVARVGQMQLLQPFLTLAAAGLLFSELVPVEFWFFTAVLTLIVALGRRMPVLRAICKETS